MSDEIRIGLSPEDFDRFGDCRMKVRLPGGPVMTILIPNFEYQPWIKPEEWEEDDEPEFGLNLVCGGHYT